MRRAGVRVLALGALLALGGCDGRPEGPGVLSATVLAPEPLGAVVLEFTGPGIVGFEGQGTTLVYSAPTPADPSAHRVILVSPTGGREIRFGIEMTDRAGPLPAVAAVEASSPANARVLADGLEVRIER